MPEEEAECVVMAFSSEPCGGSASTKYVCVSKGGLAFRAYGGEVVLSSAFVDVYTPGHFK